MKAKDSKLEAQDGVKPLEGEEDRVVASPKYERPPPRAGQIPKQIAVNSS